MSMNLERAREVALQIRKDDGAHWYQGSWWSRRSDISGTMPAADLLERKCGTTGCVAGWAVALNYPQAVFSGTAGFRTRPGGLLRDIDVSAQDYLNLSDAQARWLFSGLRQLSDVLWALENEDGNWRPAGEEEGETA